MGLTTNLGVYIYFILIVPGFLAVWSYGAGRKNRNNIESICIFIICGLINLLLWQWINSEHVEKVKETLNNPFAAVVVLSLFAIIVGLAARIIFKWGPIFIGLVIALFKLFFEIISEKIDNWKN